MNPKVPSSVDGTKDFGPQPQGKSALLGPGKHWQSWFEKNKLTMACILGLLTILLCVGFLICGKKPANSTLDISGRIECPETHISSPAGTRVNSVLIKEGDVVHKGQLILTLDAQAVKAGIQAATSAIAEVRAAQGQANQQVAAAQADINHARAKSHGFFAKIFTSRKKKEAEEDRLRTEMMQAQMMSHQAQSGLNKAKAADAQATAKLSYFNITSPLDGVCTTRSAEPGDLVGTGQVLLVLVDPKSAYMKGYVPEGNIARVRLGQSAEVYLDSEHSHPLKAKLTAIDTAPSFTPENVYFKKDRVRQVFGVKLSIDTPDGSAKPGMPADAKIQLIQEHK